MDALAFLAVAVLLVAVAAVVAAPLRAGRERGGEETVDVEALEAAKQAKYREIRDAELDRRMGKLSEEDWRALDRQLRGEAVEILRRIDEAGAS